MLTKSKKVRKRNWLERCCDYSANWQTNCCWVYSSAYLRMFSVTACHLISFEFPLLFFSSLLFLLQICIWRVKWFIRKQLAQSLHNTQSAVDSFLLAQKIAEFDGKQKVDGRETILYTREKKNSLLSQSLWRKKKHRKKSVSLLQSKKSEEKK